MRHCQQVSGDALATSKTAVVDTDDFGLMSTALSHSLHLVSGKGPRDIKVLLEEGNSSHHVDSDHGAVWGWWSGGGASSVACDMFAVRTTVEAIAVGMVFSVLLSVLQDEDVVSTALTKMRFIMSESVAS